MSEPARADREFGIRVCRAGGEIVSQDNKWLV